MNNEETKGMVNSMNLINLNLKLLNLDIVKMKDKDSKNDVELLHIQGVVPMSESEKNRVLFGEYKCLDIWSACCDELDELIEEARLNNVDTVNFCGYYNDKRKFKIVTIDGIVKKKK